MIGDPSTSQAYLPMRQVPQRVRESNPSFLAENQVAYPIAELAMVLHVRIERTISGTSHRRSAF